MSTRLRACLQRPACVGCLINMIKTTKWDLGLLSVLFHDSAIRCNQAGVLLKSWSFVVPYQVYTRDLSLPKHGPFAPKGKASTWNKKRSGNEYLPNMTDDKHFPSNPPIGFICSRSKHQLVATLDFVLHPQSIMQRRAVPWLCRSGWMIRPSVSKEIKVRTGWKVGNRGFMSEKGEKQKTDTKAICRVVFISNPWRVAIKPADYIPLLFYSYL